MKNLKIIASIGVIILILIAVTLILVNRQSTIPPQEGCNDIYEPVCGADGVTYDNACLAGEAGAAVERSGPCSSSTTLTSEERIYLSWLLRKRIEFELKEEPIVHVSTEPGDCEDCTVYTYAWENQSQTAAITVQNGVIIEAQGNDGTDYTQGNKILPVTQ